MRRHTTTGNKRGSRGLNKLREKGFALLGLGIALLIAPSFLPHSALGATVASAFKTPGWVGVLAGAAMLALSQFLKKSVNTPERAQPLADAPRPPARESAARDPAAGPIIDDVAIPRAEVTRPEKSDGVEAPPTRPTEWSAAVFDVIEWRRFEALCERVFRQAGFETKSQSHGADGGVDVWLHSKNFPDGPVSVVQCKCWSAKPVKVAEMRALLGSMADKKVGRGIFATTSSFTADAADLAKNNRIQLLDREALLALIRTRTLQQQAELLEVATEGEYWIPTCASCGVKMTRRSPKSGGKQFWGCVNFPRCRTVLNG